MSQRIYQLVIIASLIVLMVTELPPAYAQSPVDRVAISHVGATAEPEGDIRVSALVSVTDAEGQFVPGLTSADFVVTENATPIEPQQIGVTMADDSVDVALLLDTSSGLAKPGPTGVRAIDSMKDAAVGLVEGLKEGDQVVVYQFNSQLQMEQELTYDHNLAIDQGVVRLDALGSAEVCLYDALLQAIERMATEESRRMAIIVYTGSDDSADGPTCRGATVDDVIDRLDADARTIAIYSVAFGNEIDPEALAWLARRTGGYSTVGADPTTLADLTALISGQLRNQYEISYPSQAPDSLSQISITENSSQQSDRRRVLIPKVVEPTSTPVPQFSIGLTVNQPSDNQLEVVLELPAGISLEKTELFVNNELVQRAVEPPFDRYRIDILELGSGQHTLRAEATDLNGLRATSQVELTLTIPPTPVPVATPTPPPTATPDTSLLAFLSEDGGLSTVAVALIGVGFAILVILLSVIAYLLYIQSRRPVPVQLQPVPDTPSGSQETLLDMGMPTPLSNTGPETMLDLESSIPAVQPGNGSALKPGLGQAKLVVIDGHQTANQTEYVLNEPETKIGRNSAGKILNDIEIKDREVSRSHAKIIYRNQEFFIQDTQSSTGTRVDGVKLSHFQDTMLKHGAEIAIGPNAKFRFEMIDPNGTQFDLGINNQWPDDADDDDRTVYELK